MTSLGSVEKDEMQVVEAATLETIRLFFSTEEGEGAGEGTDESATMTDGSDAEETSARVDRLSNPSGQAPPRRPNPSGPWGSRRRRRRQRVAVVLASFFGIPAPGSAKSWFPSRLEKPQVEGCGLAPIYKFPR